MFKPEAAMGTAADFAVSLDPVADLAAVERLWVDLERRADPSFFLSWHWIGCWLHSLPAAVRPLALGPLPLGTAVGARVHVNLLRLHHRVSRMARRIRCASIERGRQISADTG